MLAHPDYSPVLARAIASAALLHSQLRGGLALCARVHWGAALTASALGVEAAATVANLIAEPGGVMMIERVLSVI
jgi:hypothetical protein